MDYELCKKLKEARFPQICNEGDRVYCRGELCIVGEELAGGESVSFKGDTNELEDWCVKIPTLEELIEACGEDFTVLYRDTFRKNWAAGIDDGEDGGWLINLAYPYGQGSTPSEAVAMLWLQLNKK